MATMQQALHNVALYALYVVVYMQHICLLHTSVAYPTYLLPLRWLNAACVLCVPLAVINIASRNADKILS